MPRTWEQIVSDFLDGVTHSPAERRTIERWLTNHEIYYRACREHMAEMGEKRVIRTLHEALAETLHDMQNCGER